MCGIYLINPRINLFELSPEESFKLQEKVLLEFIKKNKLKVIKLNPYQLYDYYTIPEALLYDLKLTNIQLDFLIYYSQSVIEDYIRVFPARWLILKSYFDKHIVICS
jgi:hypothetical protein